MPASVKHIRGTRAEWLENDPIIPDGEIALSMQNGGYSIVVGDGATPFSGLRGSRPKIVQGFDDYIISIQLCDNDDIRLREIEELYIAFPEAIPTDFSAMVTFTCGEFGTMFSYPSDIKIFFSGADVRDRDFFPVEMNRYTLFFWYDGQMQCHVRSVRFDYDD